MAFTAAPSAERRRFVCRATGHYAPLFWTMVVCNCVIPLLLFFKRVAPIHAGAARRLHPRERRHVARALRHHRHLARPRPRCPSSGGIYHPTLDEFGITLGSFGWFFFWFLLFVKLLPAVSIAEIKESPPWARGRACMPREPGVLGVFKTPGRRPLPSGSCGTRATPGSASSPPPPIPSAGGPGPAQPRHGSSWARPWARPAASPCVWAPPWPGHCSPEACPSYPSLPSIIAFELAVLIGAFVNLVVLVTMRIAPAPAAVSRGPGSAVTGSASSFRAGRATRGAGPS